MRKRPLCLMAVLLAAGILLARLVGISWIWRSPQGSFLEEAAEKTCSAYARGTVYRQEEKKFTNQTYTYLYLKHASLLLDSEKYPIRNLKCIIEKEMPSMMGQALGLNGTLTLPQMPKNPGEFNKREYEHSGKIDFYLEKARVEEVGNSSEILIVFFARMRESCVEILEKIFPPREAGIMEAMLLGEKGGLESEIKGFYQAAGISHTIAISGLHISLLGMAVWNFLKRLGMPVGVSAGLAFGLLTGYGMLIGNPTTAFRALVMFGIMMGAKVLGRAYDMLSALAAAGILLLLDNPDLMGNCGFQLSFLAVMGIGFSQKVLKKTEGKEEGKIRRFGRSLGRNLASGTLLWFFTLPVVLLSFYQVSFVGILCNLLVIPLMPLVLGSGVFALVLGTVDIRLGSVAGIPAYGILHLYEGMGAAAEQLPFGVWTPGKPSLGAVFLYYGTMAVVWGMWKKRKDEKKNAAGRGKEGKCWRFPAAGILGGTAVILLTILAEPWKNGKQIGFLDVGQGDGIVVQAERAAVLIDGGSSSQTKAGTYVILPYLKHQGIARLSAVFLTHTDQDHTNGVQEVLEEAKKGWLSVENLFMPEWMRFTEEGKHLAETARASGTKCRTLKAGDQVQVGEINLHILHPDGSDFSKKPNEGSLVFMMELGGMKGLFTGDLPVEEEEKLLEETGDCDLLKVGHHGSNGSSSENFLKRARPEISVISCGENNRYGHPGEEALKRLIQAGSRIFRTDRQGAVIAEEKGGRWKVRGTVH
ncbi:MAG: ComEC/Rec2 family competence protein [Clostridiales bacterium]|nr:ComEC/Rec2 family competence protein [Clostridiales bacterium]